MGKLKFAFMGFRHGHIMAVYHLVNTRLDTERVAACEEDDATRKKLLADGKVAITHSDFQTMLDQVPCDVIAVGDYYGKRGSIIIQAMKQGKHVISDKPVCTSLAEMDEIRTLASRQRLVVSCQFDLRDTGIFREMRRLIRSGEIGEVHAVSFNGQHPLNYGTRPGWYFEEGKQGGTLNDIAIHAMDAIPWLTGLQFVTINAARHWNARLKQVPFFKEAAQVMMTMNNGCGVLGDVSYLAPDSLGYSLPQYWRMTFWGEKGVIENNYVTRSFTLYRKNGEAPRAKPRGIFAEPSEAKNAIFTLRSQSEAKDGPPRAKARGSLLRRPSFARHSGLREGGSKASTLRSKATAEDGSGCDLPSPAEAGYAKAGGREPQGFLAKEGEKEGCHFASLADHPGGYLESFLQEIRGQSQELHLSSAEVLQASRIALLVQQAADQQLTNVAIT